MSRIIDPILKGLSNYFTQLSTEQEENGGQEKLSNGKGQGFFFVFHLRKKQLLPSFSEGIANNGGERKTRDAKPSPAINSPVINSPVWAAGLPQPSGPVTLCQLRLGSAFPLPALLLQARVPPSFHRGATLPVGKC